MKAFVGRCCYCFGAWLILVVNLLVTIAAQVPEESQESPWVSICRLTDPIVAAYNKSNDRASYQKSFEPLAQEAMAFTEQETVSLILSAASIEHKGYLYRELSSRLAAIRLAKHCQNEHESKFLEAATSSDFSRLDLTILAAITVLDWKFPKSVTSLTEKVLLESNDLDWLQENASWYLASLVVGAGDQQRINHLKRRLAELQSGQQPPKPEDFYKGGVRYNEETKGRATTHWRIVRSIEDALEVERVCQELEPDKQPLFRDFYRRLVHALACRPTGFRAYDEEFRRAVRYMMKHDQDREFYSLFFTKISQSDFATHLVQHLYLASETPLDMAIIEKAAQRKDQKGHWAAGILAVWRRRSTDVK